jgi:hypothetical protein
MGTRQVPLTRRLSLAAGDRLTGAEVVFRELSWSQDCVLARGFHIWLLEHNRSDIAVFKKTSGGIRDNCIVFTFELVVKDKTGILLKSRSDWIVKRLEPFVVVTIKEWRGVLIVFTVAVS